MLVLEPAAGIILTFALTILGHLYHPSGVISPVHAFGTRTAGLYGLFHPAVTVASIAGACWDQV